MVSDTNCEAINASCQFIIVLLNGSSLTMSGTGLGNEKEMSMGTGFADLYIKKPNSKFFYDVFDNTTRHALGRPYAT
jgi:hypothetical protein